MQALNGCIYLGWHCRADEWNWPEDGVLSARLKLLEKMLNESSPDAIRKLNWKASGDRTRMFWLGGDLCDLGLDSTTTLCPFYLTNSLHVQVSWGWGGGALFEPVVG